MDHFVDLVRSRGGPNVNSFQAALDTDVVLDMLRRDAELGPRTVVASPGEVPSPRRQGVRGWFARRRDDPRASGGGD
jgi:hypothetical protein